MKDVILAYDIGGTYIKFGLFSPAGDLLNKGRFPTVPGEGLVGQLKEHIANLNRTQTILGISVGIPGLVNAGMVLSAVNLGLIRLPLKDQLEAAFEVPVTLCNDATLAAWGEKQAGGVSDPDHFMLVTLGTGIGSGVVLGGHLIEGRTGAFGELGHTVVVPEGRPCRCGNRGCLERYASADGLLETYRKTIGELQSVEELLQAEAEDVAKVVDQAAKTLGLGLANAALLLDVGVIVIGGGLAEIPGFLARIAYWTNEQAMPAIRPLSVEKAALGNDAALYGAFHYWDGRKES